MLRDRVAGLPSEHCHKASTANNWKRQSSVQTHLSPSKVLSAEDTSLQRTSSTTPCVGQGVAPANEPSGRVPIPSCSHTSLRLGNDAAPSDTARARGWQAVLQTSTKCRGGGKVTLPFWRGWYPGGYRVKNRARSCSGSAITLPLRTVDADGPSKLGGSSVEGRFAVARGAWTASRSDTKLCIFLTVASKIRRKDIPNGR